MQVSNLSGKSMSTLRDACKRYNITTHTEERLPLIRTFRLSSSMVGQNASSLTVIGVNRATKLAAKMGLDRLGTAFRDLATAEPPAVYNEEDTSPETPEVSHLRLPWLAAAS